MDCALSNMTVFGNFPSLSNIAIQSHHYLGKWKHFVLVITDGMENGFQPVVISLFHLGILFVANLTVLLTCLRMFTDQ